jgi:hypothetical protein
MGEFVPYRKQKGKLTSGLKINAEEVHHERKHK